MTLCETHLPYCLRRLPDGRYMILNREYRPLGAQTAGPEAYENHPYAVALAITPAIAQRLACPAGNTPPFIHLYAPEEAPTRSAAHMKAYLARLAVLMALKAAAA